MAKRQKQQLKISKTTKQKLVNDKKVQGKSRQLHDQQLYSHGHMRYASNQCLIEQMMRPNMAGLMQGFSDQQKRIIQQQFGTMMKKLKIKLKSPQKIKKQIKSHHKNVLSDKERDKIQSKTQRIQYIDFNKQSNQVSRKNMTSTQRKKYYNRMIKNTNQDYKTTAIKSYKDKNQTKPSKVTSTSPKKSIKKTQTQKQREHIQSPQRRKKKDQKTKKVYNGTKKQALQFQKDSKNGNQCKAQDNYYLYGDNFIDVNMLQQSDRQMYSQIIMQESGLRNVSQMQQQSNYANRSDRERQVYNMWNQFINQKQSCQLSKIQAKQSHILGQNIRKKEAEEIKRHKNVQDKIMLWNRNNKYEQVDDQQVDILNQTKSLIQDQQVSQQQPQQENQKSPTNFQQSKSNSSINCSNDRIKINNSINTFAKQQERKQQCIIKSRVQQTKRNLQTNKQILQKLLKMNKIDRKQYENYMDIAIEHYEQQIMEIEQLQQMISIHQQKVDTINKINQQNLSISDKLSLYLDKISKSNTENAQANELDAIINKFVANCNNNFGQNSKTNKEALDIDSVSRNQQLQQDSIKNQSDMDQKCVNLLDGIYQDKQQKEMMKSKVFKKPTFNHNIENLISNEQKNQNKVINKETTKLTSIKHQIELRTALQLGFVTAPISPVSPINNNQFPTSVVSVYQFIRNFFLFIKKYHLSEFLTFVNMPYGYSVQQRLLYMQGYDDNHLDANKNDMCAQVEENKGVIYGLQEVFRSSLLNQFHTSFMYKHLKYQLNKGKNQQNYQINDVNQNQYQKIHNNAIFDAINESMNQYRPYYFINGIPYPWTTTQRALTYYFIRQDCFEQLFEKVQLQVLKWSSSLCGLLVTDAVTKIPNVNNAQQMLSKVQERIQFEQNVSIQQIFERYTIQTQCQLLQNRQQKVIASEKKQIQQTNFSWQFHDEYKTALLYQISSCILEDICLQLSSSLSILKSKKNVQQIFSQYQVSQESQIY